MGREVRLGREGELKVKRRINWEVGKERESERGRQ